jgi:cAMP-dependent protein kinase regulator
MIGNLLRHSSILSAIPGPERAELIARFKAQRFEPAAVLVNQGEEASSLYLIASGGVQVRSREADGDRVVLAELGAGEVVGEISLVLRRPATAEVVAIHPTVALTLTREEFHEAIREHPSLLRELYEVAIQRDEETRSIVAQRAEDATEIILL